METVTFKVEGMSCGGCVTSITRVLQGMAGVRDADVKLDEGSARVTYDETTVTSTALRSAIEDAGYDVVG